MNLIHQSRWFYTSTQHIYPVSVHRYTSDNDIHHSTTLALTTCAHGGGGGGETMRGDDTEQEASASGARDDTNYSILGMTSRKSMSMKQRQRALHMYLQAWSKRMVEQVTVIKAVVDWVEMHVTPSYTKYRDGWMEWKAGKIAEYEQYLAEETKERWSWEKRHRKELALLERIPPYIGMVVATLLYQVFVPLSMSCAVVLPLYCSWILYDSWWTSPIILGMILISPWKGFLSMFSSSSGWCLLWPTLL